MPDVYVAVGYETLQPVLSQINLLTMSILAVKLCPPGAEAAIFAFNMGLTELGSQVGSHVGVGLLRALGGVEAPEYVNLRALVFLCSVARLVPLLFVVPLVPDARPAGILEACAYLPTRPKARTQSGAGVLL